MDLEKIISELYREKQLLDEAIETLEAMSGGVVEGVMTQPKRRGRKGMNQSERLAVSRRMKKYWEARRNE